MLVGKLAKDSRAAQNGLAEGDLIAAVNQAEVHDLADLEARVGGTRRLLLTIVRGRRGFYVEMQ